MKEKTIKTLLLFCLCAVPTILNAEDAKLPFGLRSVLEVRNIPADTISIHVEDLETGQPVLQWLHDEARNPASTMKIITTLVAMDMLGPTYQWKTDVFALGEIKNGKLEGDLLLKGYGDPFLVTERVWQMLRLIRQAGIHDINGDLLIDDSWFDVQGHDPAAFDKQPLRAYNVAPNALMMNFKVVRYLFEPDFDRNAVHVQVDPPLENLVVDNRLSLSAGSCRGYQRGISISANEAIDKMTFSGKFPKGCKRYSMDRTVLEHGEFAYGLFRSLWLESGGRFEGTWQPAQAPEDMEPMLSFDSLPLSQVAARVNKYSNNVMARQLLYTLAAEIRGEPGTEKAGREVVNEWLARHGLDGVHLDNGAGLSREARITASQFSTLLRYAWEQPYMPEFLASLSLSGLDGTSRRRIRDRSLAGKAHLKTGSLDHVSAVAGYMQAKSGRRFSVVVLQNHQDIHRGPGDEVHIALLKWLNDQ